MTEKKRKYQSPDRLEAVRDYFKRHPIQRRAVNAAIWPILKMDSIGRDHSSYTGMLKGTVISEKLLYPSDEPDGTTYGHAHPGRWLAYDFHRPEVLRPSKKHPVRQLFEGRLRTYMLDEFQGQPGNQETPTFNYFDVLQGLVVYHPGIKDLVDEEFVTPTTHEGAYRQVGAYEEHAEAIHSRGVAEDRVYQVTPKGNTLIFLVPDGGTHKPHEDTEKSSVFGLLPGPAHGAAALVLPTQVRF